MRRTLAPFLIALLLATLACGRAAPPGFLPDEDSGTDSDSDSDSDTDSDSDSDIDTDTYDCDNLIQGPLDISYVPGPIASEDIAFDDEGNLVGSDNTAIFKTPFGGSAALFVAGLDFRAGMRYLPDGHLMYNDDQLGRLVRIDPEGVQHVVLTGLSYPNGMCVDPLGFVYVTEHNAGRVIRVDPYTAETQVLVSAYGLQNANGITFNRDYTMLYIGSWSDEDNTIFKMDIDIETGEHGPLTPWVSNVGSGWHDGMGVDACGNVYVCDWDCDEWGDTCIYRISADGVVEYPPIVNPSINIYVPNFDWGSGIGGWDRETVYIPSGWDHSVYEVHLGIPAKPAVFP